MSFRNLVQLKSYFDYIIYSECYPKINLLLFKMIVYLKEKSNFFDNIEYASFHSNINVKNFWFSGTYISETKI